MTGSPHMATFDWQVFLQDTGGGETYLSWPISAWGRTTLSVALLALIVALLSGSLMGILRQHSVSVVTTTNGGSGYDSHAART